MWKTAPVEVQTRSGGVCVSEGFTEEATWRGDMLEAGGDPPG